MSWIVRALVVWVLCVSGMRAFGQVAGYATSLMPVRPGVWTVLNGRIVNNSNSTVNAMMVVSEAANRDVQFTMPVWVPEHANLVFPVPFITTGDKYNRQFDLEVRLVQGSGGSEMDLSKVPQPLAIDDGDSPTGIYWELGNNAPPDMVIQLRAAATGHRKGRIASFDRRNRPYPSSMLNLLSLSDIVIATPDKLTPAQAMAVRQWLVQGGHLWIMADRVTPEMSRLILGDDWTCEVAEETELARVNIAETRPTGGGVGGGKMEEYKTGPYEQPIRMVRLVQTGMEVTHKIDGWPAIMWRNVGRGKLLVTTFDITGMEIETGKEPPQWYRDIADRFLSPVRSMPPGAASAVVDEKGGGAVGAMHELASNLVGHDVVKRGPVMAILGLLCVVLLVAGLALQRKSRLEYLAPTALVLTVVATIAMLALGAASKGTEPLTIASVSEARMVPLSGLAPFSGAADVYSPSAFDGSMGVRPGGWILPELANQAGHIVRLSWGELTPMTWQHLRFPSAATLRGTVGGVMVPEEKVAVSGTFGADGFEGTMSGKALAEGKDFLLVNQSGRFAPRLVNGKLVAGAGDQLAADEVAGPGIISHEREERIKATKPILAEAPSGGMTLYAWVEGMSPGVQVEMSEGTHAEERVRTLMGVPVSLVRPAENATITVPSGFMRIGNHRIPMVTSQWYDDRTGTFPGRVPGGGTTILRFELPSVVSGMHVDKGTLKVSVNAPDRTVRLFVAKPGAKTVKDFKFIGPATVVGPIQPIELELSSEDLQADAGGGILVGLEVSQGKDTMSVWELNGMTLSVSGQLK